MSDDETSRKCVVCGTTNGIKSCPACNLVAYCSKEHQALHWKAHKPNCVKPVDVRDVSSSMASLAVTSQPDAVHQDDHHDHNDPNDHVAEDHAVDRVLPRNLPSHISRSWMVKIANNIVTCLNKFGIAVVNKFLHKELGEKILKEAILLHDRHLMTDGQTIRPSTSGDTAASTRQYRRDKISWVDGVEPDCTHIGVLVTLMDSIMQQVQKLLTDYNIKGRTKAMVACYPGRGSNYMRHIDNPVKDGRLLTCIYYLNKDWNSRVDGGALRIYPQGSTQVAEIDPIMDRLIVFWSDSRNPHEVMPAYRTRFAVTTWYFDADERRNAMKRQGHKKTRLTRANT